MLSFAPPDNFTISFSISRGELGDFTDAAVEH